MIFKEMPNINPMSLCGMATKLDSNNIKIPETPYSPDFCFCDYECKESISVWGGGNLDWQNDRTTFAFIKTLPNDSFAFSLWKNGVKVADIIDNTYGDYQPSYTNNPKQYSFVINWDLVFQAFGSGIYVVKNNFTSLLNPDEYVSSEFDLCEFTDEIADGYIKFTWLQDGNIQSNSFNFCEPLFFSVKVKGLFFEDSPEIIKDSYQTSTRDVRQFRNEVRSNYLFKSKLIDKETLYFMKNNMFHAEKIKMTDFNLFGSNDREKELTFTEASSLSDKARNRKYTIDLKFQDYKQNNIKDNCC